MKPKPSSPQKHGELIRAVMLELQRFNQGFQPISDETINHLAEAADNDCNAGLTLRFLSKYIGNASKAWNESWHGQQTCTRL